MRAELVWVAKLVLERARAELDVRLQACNEAL